MRFNVIFLFFSIQLLFVEQPHIVLSKGDAFAVTILLMRSPGLRGFFSEGYETLVIQHKY